MENPSLQIGDNNWAVKDGSILGYNIIQDNYLPQPIDFTRASTATRVNAEGLIETSPYNLLQQSNTFTVSWGLSGTALTSGQAGYDGSSDAWLLSKDAVVNRYIFQYLSVSETKTFSVYAKANTLNNVRLYSTTGTSSTADFSLVDGSLLASVNILGSSSEDLGAGWWRFSITTDGTTSLFRIYPDPNGTTAGSIYIQDAQVNIGSTAKPYFPTTNRLNVPRIDYTGGGFGKLLLEPQRTNLITYSEDFSQWTKQSGGTGTEPVVTSNNTISPDGTQNADKVVFNKGTGVSASDLSIISSSAFTSQTNTSSFYIKADIPQKIVIRNSTNWQLINVTTEWQRISKTDTGGGIQIGLRDGYGISNVPNTSTVYLWGAQAEAGSYPTSYIPTTTTAVTRLADAASKTGISSLINSTEGVLYLEIAPTKSTTNQNFITLNDGSSNNKVSIRFDYADNKVVFFYTLAGVSQGVQSLSDWDFSITNKLAFLYQNSNFKSYRNGVQITTSVSGSTAIANTLNKISLDIGNGTSPFNGEIKSLIIFPSVLSDTELATLTTL